MQMRNLKLTVVVDAALRELLEEGAEREGRSVSNYTRRLIDRAAREAVRSEQESIGLRSQHRRQRDDGNDVNAAWAGIA
jgi:hypothetical protein